jgi:hypothetical protein
MIVITAPNTDSLSARLLGRHWLFIKYSEHLYLFNRKSIKYILNSSGFEILNIRAGDKITDINEIVGRLGCYNKFLQKTSEKIVNIMKIGEFEFRIKMGEMIVYAKK